MRVLLTGHDGYIGSVMTEVLREAGHEITGLDTFYFEECTFGRAPSSVGAVRVDIRDVTTERLRGYDAVIHLAALSNDPLGDLDADTTYAINHYASVRLAERGQ